MELTAPKKSVSVIKMNSSAIISLVLGALSITLVLGYLYSTAAIIAALTAQYSTGSIAALLFIFFQPPAIVTQTLRSLGMDLVALVSIGLSITAVMSGWFARKQIRQNHGSHYVYALAWVGIATGANAGFIVICIFCAYLIPWGLLAG